MHIQFYCGYMLRSAEFHVLIRFICPFNYSILRKRRDFTSMRSGGCFHPLSLVSDCYMLALQFRWAFRVYKNRWRKTTVAPSVPIWQCSAVCAPLRESTCARPALVCTLPARGSTTLFYLHLLLPMSIRTTWPSTTARLLL